MPGWVENEARDFLASPLADLSVASDELPALGRPKDFALLSQNRNIGYVTYARKSCKMKISFSFSIFSLAKS